MNTVVNAAAQGWFESMRLAWGAWLSSPGAGVLGAVGALGAGWFAFAGVTRRIRLDRDLAREARAAEREKDRENDARQRWWEAYNHLWANRDQIERLTLVEGVRSLGQAAETVQQSLMAEVFLRHIIESPRQGGR